MTKIMRKIPENTVMCIPDWMTNYQPVNDVDARVFNNFRQLYQEADGSRKQQRVISQIYNILVSQGLLLTSSHENYNDAVLKNFQWLSNIIIEITPELINLLTEYCQNHQSETIDKIQQHLQTLSEQPIRTRKYREAENYLGKQIDNLLTELKNENSDFVAVLEDNIRRIPRIKKFDPLEIVEHLNDFYFPDIFALWINKNLGKRIGDLYNPNRQPKQVNINDVDIPPEPQPPAEVLILIYYIENDPHGLLKSRHIPGYPDCNYQILAQRLILQTPPDKIRDIYRDFNIPQAQEQKVYSHLTRTFYPIIASIRIELGEYPQGFQDAILNDVDGSLKKCDKKIQGRVVYNAQILAQKLLPLFHTPEFIFQTIVNYLNNKEHELRTTQLYLDVETSFAIYSEITSALKRQGVEKITVFHVLTYWETATIETFVKELNNQGFKKITSQKIKSFWETKARISLGKLAISLNKGDK